MRLYKILVIVAISFVGALALLTTSAGAFSLTGVQLTRVDHENFANVAITNPTHKTREYHIIVKPAGKKEIKFNTYVRSGETAGSYIPTSCRTSLL